MFMFEAHQSVEMVPYDDDGAVKQLNAKFSDKKILTWM
jgi:hypothetical protein